MMQDVILHGDALAVLKTLESESVQCIVTSPPYFGLRDYGLPPSVWGGSPVCQHEWGAWQEAHDEREGKTHGKSRTTDRSYGDASRRFDGNHQKHTAGAFCELCGAWQGCLGLEPTPALYVEHLVMIFREARRVLCKDGTFWLNLGDSYNGSGKGGNPDGSAWGEFCGSHGRQTAAKGNGNRRGTVPTMNGKNLLGMPWRVAFALQDDGWILRSDIIWSKGNPMPESVRDRPTKAHEYVFLFSKSERYYYDAAAIAEPTEHGANGSSFMRGKTGHHANQGISAYTFQPTRNKRSVWNVNTQPFPEAHFAVMPQRLIEPCMLAGSQAGDVVLDPFSGAGTVALVAKQHGRHYLGIELNASYIEMAGRRIAKAAEPKRAKITKLPKRPPAAAQASLWEVTA